MSETFVIVGGGLAGAKAAETLRSEGFEGRVVLVGAEPELPYERPPLTKSYLAGQSSFAEARVHDGDFYERSGVELITGQPVVALDPAAHRVTLADGSTIAYDRVLIATGSVPRRPPIPGADHPAVRTFRTVADADSLRALLRTGARLAVIGAGWIGSELAATARGLGAEVTVIDHAAAPLQHVLGPRVADFFAGVHRSHGVELRMNARVSEIADGRRVVLGDGDSVEADAIVLGVGVQPEVSLAEAAGLRVDDGIVTDERLRTSVADVYAAGDVASVLHPRYGRRVRVEHWANAADQGAAAARSMLGSDDAYAKVPYFFSDQYDLGMEYFGLHGPGDELEIRGDLESACFQAYWTGVDGRVTAAMHVNDWDASEQIRAAVEQVGAPG